jgi:hypothetical protein
MGRRDIIESMLNALTPQEFEALYLCHPRIPIPEDFDAVEKISRERENIKNNMGENFENIKVGDWVVIHSRYGDTVEEVKKVNKATFSAGGVLFYKRHGWERSGDPWNHRWAELGTPKKLSKVRKEEKTRNMVNYLMNFPYSNLDYETLEQVFDILKNAKNQER